MTDWDDPGLERLDRWLNPRGLDPCGRWIATAFGGSFWVSGIDKERLPATIAAVVELERTDPIDGPIVQCPRCGAFFAESHVCPCSTTATGLNGIQSGRAGEGR